MVDAADILDVHAMAMVLAVGATAAHPRLAIELAAELAGTRGAEDADPGGRPSPTCSPRSRPACARRSPGWASAPSRRYIGGALFDIVELAPEVVARCFPTAAAWPGRTTLADLGASASSAAATPPSRAAEPAAGREPRLPDPGLARFRADGEAHLFSPRIAGEIQVLSGRSPAPDADGTIARDIDDALARYRAALAATPARPAVPRDELRVRARATPRAARRGRGRPGDRPPVRRVGDERRRPQPGGPPGADDRHPAGRRRGEHRRGRRGPGLVRADGRRPPARRAGSSRSPRPGSA